MDVCICVENSDPMMLESRGGGRFPHADRACETDDKHHAALDVGCEERAQLRRHLGPDAEPFFKARHGLMQEHAKTVDALETVVARGFEERSFKRHVDDIDGNRIRWRQAEIDAGIAGAFHPKRRGVDDQSSVANKGIARLPTVRVHFSPQIVRQSIGPRSRAIDHMDLSRTRFDQSMDDATCGATGSENQNGPIALIPFRRRKFEMTHEAVGIGVGTGDFSAL